MKKVVLTLIVLVASLGYGQVGIGTNNPDN